MTSIEFNGLSYTCRTCVEPIGDEASAREHFARVHGGSPKLTAEALAERFHETYERLAPSFSYKTREASAVAWADVPDNNKKLMIAVCAEILDSLTG